MALQPVVIVGEGAAVIYADVVAGAVVGARLDVPAGKQAVAEYVNGNTVMFQGTYEAGAHTMSLPKNKQFTFTTTGTQASLSIRWPD